MATIHKLTKDGNTIFPATITDAVVHPLTGKTLTSMIKEYNVSELFPTEGVGGGNTYTLALAIQVLGTHLGAEEKTGGLKLTFISDSDRTTCLQYRLISKTWSSDVANWQSENTDNSPTSESNNLVKSGGVFNELALGAVYNVSAKNPTSGPNNDGKFTLEYILTNADTLIPTAVRRGGMSIKFIQSSNNGYVVYCLKAAQFSINVVDWVCETMPSVQVQTGGTVTIAPNVLNLWETPVSTLTITLSPEIAGCINEYMIQFTCPQSAATSLTLPNTIRWIDGDRLEPEAGYTYQISIINNLAIYAGWEAVNNE